MLRLLNGSIGIIFLIAGSTGLMNRAYQRPRYIHAIAVVIALVTSIINLSALATDYLRGTALMLTVGVLLSYTGFLLAEARIWTFDAECGCFGSITGTIRSAAIRNVAAAATLALIGVIHIGSVILLLLVAAAGGAAGWLAPVALGPTRLLVVLPDSDLADGSTPILRLLALDSRCPECVRLARELMEVRLPLDVNGILTDHNMRVDFPNGTAHYRPADLRDFIRLPTPCVVSIRHDGAVLSIRQLETSARNAHYLASTQISQASDRLEER